MGLMGWVHDDWFMSQRSSLNRGRLFVDLRPRFNMVKGYDFF
jgi:hypothetical protein